MAFVSIFFFFFNDTATTEIYTLSLHDALPISVLPQSRGVFVSPRPPRLKTRGQGRRLALARPRYAGAGYGYRHTSPTQPLVFWHNWINRYGIHQPYPPTQPFHC